jgi:LPXTG-motif cell wall-anchored protein
MLRRLAATVGAVLAAIVIPTSAASAGTDFTYSPDEYTVTVCAPTVTVGVPCAVNASGPAGNASFTLTIPGVPDSAIEVAGSQTAATVDGSAEFSVTFPEPGTFTLTVTDAEGQVVGTGSVTAVLPSDAGGGVAGDGGLVATGPTSMPYLIAAGVLLALGLAALLVTRMRGRDRRKATADSSL